MEGALILLVLLAMGSRKKANGNGAPTGNGNGAPAGGRPPGNPPGGCRKYYTSPASTVEALNMLGYSPMPEIWGPDAVLGTGDAVPDRSIERFQMNYNDASRRGILGPNAGGLGTDGLMGKCTMAGMWHATQWVGAAEWRALYPAPEVVGLPTG